MKWLRKIDDASTNNDYIYLGIEVRELKAEDRHCKVCDNIDQHKGIANKHYL